MNIWKRYSTTRAKKLYSLTRKGLVITEEITNVSSEQEQPAEKPFVFGWYTGNQIYVEGLMARLTTEQQVSVVVKPVTAGNHPAKIDGDVVFTSSDEAVATVTSVGQYGAVVRAVGAGAAQITAVFDADLSGEKREIILSGAVEVVDAEATNGVLEFGEPELQPVP